MKADHEVKFFSTDSPCADHWRHIEEKINEAGALLMLPVRPQYLGSYAMQEDALVGGCNALLILECLHVQSLWTAPALRRQGIARHLLNTSISRAIQLGARHFLIETENDSAKRLYEDYGFIGLADVPGVIPGSTRRFFSMHFA